MDNKMTEEQIWRDVDGIERRIACGEIKTTAVFTLMKQLFSQALSAPRVPNIEHPHAVSASIKMLRSEFQGARCDSDGVSGCVHCNVMFLCAQVEKLLAASPAPAGDHNDH